MRARHLALLLALLPVTGAARADVRVPPDRPPWSETPKPVPNPGEKQLPPAPPAPSEEPGEAAGREADEASCQRARGSPRTSVLGLTLVLLAAGSMLLGLRGRTGPRAAPSGR